jgi:hypothetical protein
VVSVVISASVVKIVIHNPPKKNLSLTAPSGNSTCSPLRQKRGRLLSSEGGAEQENHRKELIALITLMGLKFSA